MLKLIMDDDYQFHAFHNLHANKQLPTELPLCIDSW